jgi:hypothetical protein
LIVGALLGAFLAHLGLSWEAWWPKFTEKMNMKRIFKNRMFLLSELSRSSFGGHLGSIWAVLDPKMGLKFNNKYYKKS